MPLPDFLIIGFPRCGTTFLMKTLDMHSHVYLPQREVAFFNKRNESLAAYKMLFQEGKVNGEKTPNYIRNKKSMERIYETIPEVKLIVCVRYPIQALHSFYNQRVRTFYLNNLNTINPEEYSFSDIINQHLDISGVSMTNYKFIDFIEENVLSIFKRDNVKIVIQEELYKYDQESLNQLFGFIGVPDEKIEIDKYIFHDSEYKYPSINYESRSYKKALINMLHYYSPSIKQLYDFLGRRIPEWEDFENRYRHML